jgi:hypothetical protein
MTRRTGTDLVNMEQQLGAGAEASSGTVTTGQDVSSEVDSRTPETPSPLRSSKRPWPAQTFYDHDFYADGWYKDMLICMFLMALEFGIELISFTAGVGSNTIFTFAENFTSWEIYISVLLLFLYATMCISIERRPERLKWALWFFQRYNQRYKLQLFPLLRRLMLLGILVLNLSIGVSNYMGFSLSSAVLLIVFISSLHKRPAES